jgi:CHAT domain-containing protein
MTLLIKSLLIFLVIASLQLHAFSQGDLSAQELYSSGAALITKKPDKAFQLLTQAMNASLREDNLDLHIKSVNSIASFNLLNDDRREIVFSWLKDAFKLLKTSKKNEQLALLHFNIAEYYNRITIEIDTPIFHYQEAKKIWTNLKGEWSAEVSQCYHGLGNIYKYYKSDFYEAEKCYEKALLIRERIGFKDSLVLYRNFYSLAATNRSQYDFEKAVSYGVKTLEIAKSLGPERIELAHGMVANIYRDMGESRQAKKHYLEALRVNEKTNDIDSRAWYYLSLGESLKIDSLYSEALQYFHKAYSLYKLPEVQDHDLFINLLGNMLDTYLKVDDYGGYQSVRKEIFKELSAFGRLRSRQASQAWLAIAEYHSRKSNYDSALYYSQKALIAALPHFNSEDPLTNPSEAEIGINYFVNEILASKALSLRAKYTITQDAEFLRQSIFCCRLAEKLLSAQRNTLDLENSKWEFLDSNYDLYGHLISTLYQASETFDEDSLHQLAFQYFEQSKARSLADALTQAEFTDQILEQDTVFQMLRQLKHELFRTQELIGEEKNKANSQRISELRENVVNLDRKIQVCKLAIDEKYPSYFRVKFGESNTSLTEVRKIIDTNEQVILEYFWGNDTVYAIGVNDKKVVFCKIGSTDSLSASINKLLSHFATVKSTPDPEIFYSFVENAYRLYEKLLSPFSELLANKKRIQIIPDGLISQIPFEILLEEKPTSKMVNYQYLKYLIKSHSVGYAYSSFMLTNKTHERSISQPTMLAIGLTDGKKFSNSNADLMYIEGAKKELEILKGRFHEGSFLIDQEATESNFKKLAPDFDIIHLAVHGMGDKKSDFAASLYFTEHGKQEDGELHAYELYGIKLKALMAVLSSCESGLGKGYQGEGMMSMASAFTYSGCENILMSLWKVNDQISIDLMDSFYDYLSQGESVDDALRSAKLKYLQNADELTADPKVWAPLVAYGKLDEIFQHDRNRIVKIGGLIIVLLTILFISYKLLRR